MPSIQIRKNIAVSETGFMFNPGTGDSFSANPVAAEIIQLLKSGESRDSIKTALLEKYDVLSTQIDRDLDEFFIQLKEAHLLEQQ
jgi:hypothetical protein